jgi:thiamine pyrophosphate-dependent acetolactate synthase large subunit-like protein
MPDPAAIDEAADRLARAKRPLILVGGGAVGTRMALTAIAERLGAPVLSTNAGKGILPESHPLSLGCSILQKSSQQALADADVVLLVGSEVGQGDHFLPKLDISGDIIRIDIDPTELTSMYSAAVPIQADARAAMLALSSALASRKPTAQRSQGEMRVRDILARNAASMTDVGNGALLVLFRHLLFPGRRLADGHWRQDRRAASAGDSRRGRRRDHVHGQ